MIRRRIPVLFGEVEVERFLIRRKWLLINDDKRTDKEVNSSYSSSSIFALFVVDFVSVFWWFGWWFGRRLEDDSGGNLEDDSEEDVGFIRWSGTKIKEYRQRVWQWFKKRISKKDGYINKIMSLRNSYYGEKCSQLFYN